MLYAKIRMERPVKFESCGNLVNEDGFVHAHRKGKTFEVMLGVEGTLFLNVDGMEYQLSQDDFLFLFPGQTYYGTKKSEGIVSFYWAHFFPKEEYEIAEASAGQIFSTEPGKEGQLECRLPQFGQLTRNSRLQILFTQLLDIARQSGYYLELCSYALSTMLLELENEHRQDYILQEKTHLTVPVAQLEQWLQANYDTKLSIRQIAEQFGYHPAYLSTVFHKETGQTITEYINRQRIRVAQRLLVQAPGMSLYLIGEQVGFTDVKYFHRTFKRYSGLTPVKYREAFCEKFRNRQ